MTDIAALGLRIDGVDGIDRASASLGRLSGAAESAESSAQGLSSSARAASSNIDAAGRSGVVASRGIDALAGAARTAGGVFAAAFGVNSLKNYADTWKDMQSQVGAATGDMSGAAEQMKRLVDIANASYSPLSQTVSAYAGNVSTLKELGYTATQAADYTESLNHMLVLTATKGERAASVQNALSKAMAVGKLSGEGLETILASGGEVASALAKELGTTVNGLRALSSQGKITSKVVADAIIKPLDDVSRRAGEMPATVGDALTRVGTNFTELVGAVDKFTGASDTASGAVMKFADGIREISGSKEVIEGLANAGQLLAVVLGSRLAAAGLASAGAFAAANIQAIAYQATLARMAGVTPAAAAGIAAVGGASRLASAGMALLGGPVGVVVTTLGLAAFAWQKYGKSARDNADAGVLGVVDAKDGIEKLVESYEKLNRLQQQSVVAVKTEELAKAAKDSSKAVFDLGNAFEPSMANGSRAAAKFRADFAAEIKEVSSSTELSSGQMASSLAGVIDKYVSSGRASEESRAKLVQMAQAIVDAAGDASRLTAELAALTGAQAAVAAAADPVSAAMKKQEENYKKFMIDFATPDEKFKAAVAEQKELLGELYGPEVERRLRGRFLPKASGVRKGESKEKKDAEAASKYLKTLDEQLFKTQQRTAYEQMLYDIQKDGLKLSNEQLSKASEIATAIDKAADAQKKKSSEIDRQNTLYQLQERLIAAQQRHDSEIQVYGTGDRDAREMAERVALQQKQQQELRAMAHQHGQEMRAAETEAERSRLQSMFADRLAMTKLAFEQEMQLYDDHLLSKKEKDGDWQLGLQQALQNYIDNSQNMYQLAEQHMSGILTSAQESISTNLMAMVEGTKSVEDAFADMARGMAMSVIKALVDMAAQWLVYQAVQLLVGETTEKASSSAMAANAFATATQAGLAAFASTAAIPIVGPAAAPAAMAAALGVAMPMAMAVSTLSGMAHDGIDSVPATGTWLLEKGERVTTSKTSAKLDSVLERIDARQRGGQSSAEPVKAAAPKFTVNLIGAPEGTTVEQRQAGDDEYIIDVMIKDAARGGRFSTFNQEKFGLTRRGR